MKNKSIPYLKRRRTLLIKKISSLLSMVAKGSLIERYKRCGKSHCKCAQGKGHGPKYYFSVSQPKGNPKMKYIAQSDKMLFQEYIQNYLLFKKLLKEVSEINIELLTRKES